MVGVYVSFRDLSGCGSFYSAFRDVCELIDSTVVLTSVADISSSLKRAYRNLKCCTYKPKYMV